jgi:adenine/guanine phosphoribosyltransferase-like PRPP-binding protein
MAGGTVDDARTAELIERGGGGVSADGPGGGPPKYNGLADPAGAEDLARALADRLRSLDVTAIVVWEDPEDVVLGHVIGRELGLPVVRAYDADGLIGHSSGMPEHPRVALVTDAVRDQRVVLAARALAERDGGRLVATAVLVTTAELEGVGEDAGSVVGLAEAATADSEAN